MKKLISLSLLLFFFFVPVALGQWDPGGYVDTGLPSGSVEDIVSNISMWILGIFGFIGVIGFVISGIFYLTAAGNAEQEKKAKLAMTMSIIGVIVGLMGLVIINAADTLLNAGSSGDDCGIGGFLC
jgi:hypothetical protein